MTLKELQNQLAGMEEYQAKDEAALRAQAESVYKPQYEQDLLMLRDSLNSNLAQQQRNAVAPGMQRSSYNQAQQNLLRGQGLRAQGELGAAYEGNVGNALLNLMNQEQDRKTAADQYRNQLLMSIYEYGRGGSGGGSGNANATPTPTYGNPFSYLNSMNKTMQKVVQTTLKPPADASSYDDYKLDIKKKIDLTPKTNIAHK